ncbi:cytidine/deoxycytidylate deaminase family protein [Arthrobacter sp. Cr_A7]|uniref:deoxycytidylate deaminase n=1 Tax=Arthrobacter sp. Cr_A7 TaxID=3031017 RepID=UPI0023DB1FED|nr:cytidine/deoxycytidylate deaminase family protein [Arthrobacter sp. Cr_A7]MDF2051177.1 cytidine/deoxycytidylate deaminase family protein [Arthrobacter sp. Cr_A7]
MSRPSWEEYFCDLVAAVSKRATCDRGQSGCVVVRDKRIICTGYVGSPAGLPHCDDVGHEWGRVLLEDGNIREHCIRTVHAEQNALVQAARNGLSLEGSTVYCSMEPCATCTMLLISAGVERVVALKKYHAAARSREMFLHAGVTLDVLNDEVETYATGNA